MIQSKLNYYKIRGHLSDSSDVKLWVRVRRRASFVVLHALTSSEEQLVQSLPTLLCSIGRGRRQENVNFLTQLSKRVNLG